MRRRLLYVLLGLLWVGEVLAQEQVRAEFPSEGGTIVLVADRIVQESPTRWVAEGHVTVTYQDSVLKTDRLTYNPTNSDVTVRGHVEVTRGTQWLKGSHAQLNLKKETGTLYDAEGFTDQELYVRVKKLVRTGHDTYVAEDGYLTSCREGIPKWSFRIDKAHINVQSWARFANTLFRIKNVPVFYLPYVVFPTEKKKRSSGFLLPSTGTSSNKGRRLTDSLYLVLGRSADLTFTQDYFSKRGFGYGFRFRTRPNLETQLDLNSYWVNDRLNQGGWILNGVGTTRLPNGFRVVTDFNLVSDFIFRQVFSDNFFTATRTTENSRAFISNNFQTRSFNALVSRQETAFPGRNVVIRNTPAIGFKLSGERLFGSPLLLDLDTSVNSMSRTDALIDTPELTERLDFYPRLYFTVPLFQGLRLTPRLGFRETFYSDSLKATTEPSDQVQLSGDPLNRRYLDFGLDLQGWGLSRIYGDPDKGGFKHLIEPRVRYRYITGVDDFNRILRFDDVDAVADTNEVEYSLYNRFFVRRQGPDGPVTQEWLSLKIGQKYFFDPSFGGVLQEGQPSQFYPLYTLTGFPYGAIQRRFSPVTLLARLTPRPHYSFDVRGDYDARFHKFRNFSVTGMLYRSGLIAGTTYFVTKSLEPGTFRHEQLQGQIALGSFKRGLSVSSVFSYDFATSRFLNYRSRLNYFWDCCGVSVEYQGFNFNSRDERQLRFSFFLKGIGIFGTIRRPESIF